ncbi:MAG: hypothetical protein K2O15_13145 [Lachnospiraceae bacterium]|nr:hypothetical protein [Lachnospiraceae bacterium]
MSDRGEFLLRSVDQSFEEWFTDVFSKIRGEKLDIAAAVYEQIVSEKDPVYAFQYFLQNADDIISTEEQEIPPRYTAAEIQKIKYKCATCVNGILDGALRRNCSEDDFYNLLWHSIADHNPLLSEEDDIIFAIYMIWQDGRIPYFHLEEGIRMTNERFMEITRKNMLLIKKANFIVRSSLEQRTEVSALLLNILSECETQEDKTVVLAQILARLEQRTISRIYATLQ